MAIKGEKGRGIKEEENSEIKARNGGKRVYLWCWYLMLLSLVVEKGMQTFKWRNKKQRFPRRAFAFQTLLPQNLFYLEPIFVNRGLDRDMLGVLYFDFWGVMNPRRQTRQCYGFGKRVGAFKTEVPHPWTPPCLCLYHFLHLTSLSGNAPTYFIV